MRYNSFAFLLFALFFFSLWPYVRQANRPRWVTITAFSFFFYGWWDWRFTGLLALSGLIDYWAALAMVRWPQHRKGLLAVSLGSNLAILGLFKYTNFFAWNVNALLESMGSGGWVPTLDLLPPAGLSFYTFQSMSYTIDVYRGTLKPTHDVFHFFAYLSLFPQLVAGPIVRAADLLPQLTAGRPATAEERWEGLQLLSRGYFKKMVIADNLAPAVNHAFSALDASGSAPYWWLVVSMTAFQVYGDFSGYSDIARGLCKWMGYDLMVNFDRPYTSASLREFWTRWHISLTTWFRDYVYFPLGGSRGGTFASHRNTWVTMFLVGLWHGASWSFVLFGLMHAAFLTIERTLKLPDRLCRAWWGRPFAVILTMAQVWLGYVLFRAIDFGQAMRIVAAMFGFGTQADWTAMAVLQPAIPFLALGVAGELLSALPWREPEGRARRAYLAGQMLFTAVLIFCCGYLRGPGSAFVYFQF